MIAPLRRGFFVAFKVFIRYTVRKYKQKLEDFTFMKHAVRSILCLTMILCCLFSVFPAQAEQTEASSSRPVLYLHSIDVGGCASAFLLTAGNTVILVDCGTDTDARQTNKALLAYLEASGIDHIDLWFVTHYHNDHAMNLNTILSLYGTDDTRVFGPSAILPQRFLPLAAGSYTQLKDCDTLSFGDFHFVCLAPSSADVSGEVNANSLNVRMDYGDFSFLITGDFVPKDILKKHPDEIAEIDVLAYPHHGLKPLLITEKIMSVINPSCVLVASNAAGNVRVQCNEAKVKAETFCTGKAGTVVLRVNDAGYEILTGVQPGEYPYSPAQ